MKALSAIALLAMAVAACEPEDPPRQRHDDSAGHAGAQNHPQPRHAPGMISGVVTDMGHMNSMMVDQLGEADEQYDQRFIDLMIPHHQGALMMAQDAAANALSPELRQFASKIVQEQQREIATLKDWRRQWYGDTSNTTMAQHHEMMQQMHRGDSMMMMMLRPVDTTYDRRFMEMMIPHHEGAIAMAQDAAGKSKREEIRKLAQEIVTSQRQEIERMREWMNSTDG